MERYTQLFQRLENKNQGAFVPFVTLGDPDAELSLKIVDALISGGADALEIGIPFSDPLADGPTIQNANLRAFKSEITPTICFELLKRIREKHSEIPIGLLVYANLVFSNGIENFFIRCQEAGVDSVLIADVPMSESKPFRDAALKHDIAPIFICPPNGDDALLQNIGQHSRGYTYLLSRAGVTGTEKRAEMPLTHLIDKLKQYNAAPALQGFGISEPEQVAQAIKNGAAGAISGSAVVKIIENNLNRPDVMLAELTQFVSNMKSATFK
ncbi:MAG TPA: tryptophan synthase subunit alpha [Providencia sp.]|uniref:tryptophan synthase subunit alpha n=1 Tax=Providencia sp. TaxID=589 RepID=UPI000E881DD4|nr:tryptophan synthase subunit alpha [Providencia sp.]MBP6080423.1 tryptophan synthase subunit alpha [Providencia sp.]HBO22977.1 tryptophan synthase subunit alpha [Providencia sp.]